MPKRTPTPFEIPAGLVRLSGPLEARSRWIDGDKVRFRNGKPEKIGGWERHVSDQMRGTGRAGRAWNDQSLENLTVTALGSTHKLYTVDDDRHLVDITPQTNRFALYPAFKTTNADATVTVYHPSHAKLVGQQVILQNASASVGGLNMNGTWTIATLVDSDSYTFEHSGTATSTVSEYEAGVEAIYPEALTNAFTTTNTSAVVTVHHTQHDAVVGQGFTLAGGVTVGGLAMNGDWEVLAVTDADSFTFTHTSPATSSVATTGSPTISYDIPPLDENPGGAGGYGVGLYGVETYGTPRSASSFYSQPGYWTLTNFGRLLLASPYRGALYVWDPQASPVARGYRVATSPAGMKGAFVTPERFVVAWACSEELDNPLLDPMQISWCSQADYTAWIPDEFNTANSRKLTEGKQIMAAGPIGEGLSMVWTDTAAYSMRYTGSQFTFETRLAGTSCGCVGPYAWCEAGGRSFWYGNGRFHTYGSGLDQLPNQDDILDWVHANAPQTYLPKTVCFYNSEFHEVWWLFVTGTTSTEPNAYVAFNIEDGSWTTGSIEERVGHFSLGTGGTNKPYLVGADGYVYVHEKGVDANGVAMNAYIESGPFQIENGDKLVNIVGYIPDFRSQSGNVTLTMKARDRAPSAVFDTDIVTIAEDDGLVDMRLRGRVISVRIEQTTLGGTFSLGDPSVEIMGSGKKR